MSTIDIYDVANNTWYQQPTKGGPGTRTRGCAVVASAADRSSFNIFYYGGFDGIHLTDDFADDVWVLSLPSFTWTKISDGKPSHARAGHKCFLPYPDLMMVVGGYTPPRGNTLICLEDGPIALFNITSGEWMHAYDPTTYAAYGVHEKVRATIGGNSTGHATATTPIPSGWATPALGGVFSTPYDFGKIKTYWPYKPSSTNRTESPTQPPPTPEKQPKDRTGWMAPVLGVVLGFAMLTGCLLIFCIWRRRAGARRGSDVSSSHDAMSERIFYWVKGHSHRKSPDTLASSCEESETGRSPTSPQSHFAAATSPTASKTTDAADASSSNCHEMENTQIAELDGTFNTRPTSSSHTFKRLADSLVDTSPPLELHGTGLTPAEAVRRSAGFAPLVTTFSSFGSLRSSSGDSPVPVSSISGGVSDGTPSTPHPSSRWPPRNGSVLSSVSFDSSNATNAYSISSIVSPIGPTSAPMRDDDNNADGEATTGTSPLRNVMSKKNHRRRALT